MAGLAAHVSLEWVVLVNLFGLLVGFALLTDHYERGHIPGMLPTLVRLVDLGCLSQRGIRSALTARYFVYTYQEH